MEQQEGESSGVHSCDKDSTGALRISRPNQTMKLTGSALRLFETQRRYSRPGNLSLSSVRNRRRATDARRTIVATGRVAGGVLAAHERRHGHDLAQGEEHLVVAFRGGSAHVVRSAEPSLLS